MNKKVVSESYEVTFWGAVFKTEIYEDSTKQTFYIGSEFQYKCSNTEEGILTVNILNYLGEFQSHVNTEIEILVNGEEESGVYLIENGTVTITERTFPNYTHILLRSNFPHLGEGTYSVWYNPNE